MPYKKIYYTICRNLGHGGTAIKNLEKDSFPLKEKTKGVSLSKKIRGVTTNIYLWEMSEKPKRR